MTLHPQHGIQQTARRTGNHSSHRLLLPHPPHRSLPLRLVPHPQHRPPTNLRPARSHGLRPAPSILGRRLHLRRTTHHRLPLPLLHLHPHPRILGRHTQKILLAGRQTFPPHAYLYGNIPHPTRY